MHGYVPGPAPIFGTYHPPVAPQRGVAYVICPPLGWESIQCYHGLRLLGETLAAAGLPVLRLAYHGTGESAGRDEDPGRVRAWLASIHQAIDWISSLPGVRGVGLVGIRMGATLAAEVTSERELSSLVLWEPCPTGAHYAREMEILASAAPGAAAEAGATWLDAGGYVLTRETLTDLGRIDCSKLRPVGRPRVLLLGRSDRPPNTRLAEHLSACGCDVRLERPQGFKEMMVYPEVSVPAAAGFECIERWALEHAAEVEASGPVVLPTCVEIPPIRRRTVVFGPEKRLFGVISEPVSATRERPEPGVLFLTGGWVPRTSVNRMYVTLADELAERGHCALRFDVSGIGESAAEPGHPGRDPYTPSLVDDARAALSVLRGDRPDHPAWLVGLCSGAFAAFRLALDDPSVQGVILLNPLHYRPMEGSKRPDTEGGISVEHYRRVVFDLERWKRVLSDRQRIARTLGTFARSARRKAARTSAMIDRRGSVVRTLAEDLHALRSRGTEVHIVFAEGDPGQQALERQLGRSMARLEPEGVHVREVVGADHTFNSSRIRKELIESILETIGSGRQRGA